MQNKDQGPKETWRVFNYTAHQPYLFDQMMNLYMNYEVLASSIEVHCHTSASATRAYPAPVIVAIALRDSNNTNFFAGLTSEAILERKDLVSKYVTPQATAPVVIRLTSMPDVTFRAQGLKAMKR
jgi:hypothetical protein